MGTSNDYGRERDDPAFEGSDAYLSRAERRRAQARHVEGDEGQLAPEADPLEPDPRTPSADRARSTAGKRAVLPDAVWDERRAEPTQRPEPRRRGRSEDGFDPAGPRARRSASGHRGGRASRSIPDPAMQFYLFKIGIVALVLLLANAVAGWLAPKMSEPVAFHNINAQTKSEQMEVLSNQCVDLVIAGNSMGAFGIDPTLLVASDAGVQSAYNASQFGSLMSMDRQWVIDQVLPELRPSTVVIVADSVSFSSSSAALAASQRQWDHALATRRGSLADADRWAAERFTLFRDRSRLSDFEEWRALLLGDEPPPRFRDDTLPVELDDLGHAETDASLIGTPDEQRMTTFHMASLFNGKWEIDPTQLDELGALLSDLADRNVTPVVLIPPTTAQFAALHPDGQADIDQARADIVEQASAHGVAVADFSNLTRDPADFWDTHHLNNRGAALLTNAFGDWLAANNAQPAPCRG